MRRTRRTSKATTEEIARAIERDGRCDVFHSGSYCKIYYAFGQKWRISLSHWGTVKSVEQIREDGTPVSLR